MQRHADVIEVVLVMVTLTTQHLNGQVTACKNPPSGLDRQGRGVDITKLDLLPLEFTGHDGFKGRVIEYTCEKGKTISVNGVQYQLPDQVWSMDNIPSGWVSSDVQIFKNYKEVKNSLSLNVGGDLKISKFGFSASYSYTRMQNTIANISRYIERVSAFDSATRIDLMPYWSLAMSSVAKAFVDEKLSATFQENPAPYEEFINYFGTHFFKSAKFGGIIMLHLETSSDYYRGKQERSVKAEVEASFLEILKAKGGYSGNTSKSDKQFQEMTTKTIRYYGGNTNLLKTSSLQDWQPTVNEHPWLFSAELEQISVLFTNISTRESVEYAITNHLLQAYLKEMERLLRLQRGSWSAGLSTLDSLTKQVDIMKSARILEESTVENLGNQIEKQVIIPTWFVEQTQLCYQWYADGNRGQCGGGIAELLCATPNTMTSYYLDNSDDRAGGCRMRWGITVYGHDSWFNEVQVCYRWNTTGDAGQCGGGIDRELCAPVNSYTTYYRDDTDKRTHGCLMSWRLVVPNSAPVWAQNVQMCFNWYPDGDAGQCGIGTERNLCAQANQWTAWYRDDTDSRSGGCRMRWGLKLN